MDAKASAVVILCILVVVSTAAPHREQSSLAPTPPEFPQVFIADVSVTLPYNDTVVARIFADIPYHYRVTGVTWTGEQASVGMLYTDLYYVYSINGTMHMVVCDASVDSPEQKASCRCQAAPGPITWPLPAKDWLKDAHYEGIEFNGMYKYGRFAKTGSIHTCHVWSDVPIPIGPGQYSKGIAYTDAFDGQPIAIITKGPGGESEVLFDLMPNTRPRPEEFNPSALECPSDFGRAIDAERGYGGQWNVCGVRI